MFVVRTVRVCRVEVYSGLGRMVVVGVAVAVDGDATDAVGKPERKPSVCMRRRTTSSG